MILESHRHDYDEMLAQEARQTGFSPRWIPLLVPLYAVMLVSVVYFVIFEVL
jgi:hypothetical protein